MRLDKIPCIFATSNGGYMKYATSYFCFCRLYNGGLNMQKYKFDNRVQVFDASDQPQHPTYLHRAKGLVKQGRAEWINEKSIRLLETIRYTHDFMGFLKEKGKTPKQINELTGLCEMYRTNVKTDVILHEAIDGFVRYIESNGIKGDGVGWGSGASKAAYRFLDVYAEFMGAPFADAYAEHQRQAIDLPARTEVNQFKKSIVFIPDGTQIDPYFLQGLTNDEFVGAFRALQQMIYAIYEEIERTSPAEWGWRRGSVMGTLAAMVLSGEVMDDALIVNKHDFYGYGKFFFGYSSSKDKTATGLMVDGLGSMGFIIEGFHDKKSDTFTVTCPDTPLLVTVLAAYFNGQPKACAQCHMADHYPCHNHCNSIKYYMHQQRVVLSYRFVEKLDPTVSGNDRLVLAMADSAPPELGKILTYLHDQAAQHGFDMMPWTPWHNGCLRYWRGTKTWLTIGSGTHWDDAFHSQQSGQWAAKSLPDTPPLFNRIFKKHPNEAKELVKRFAVDFGRKESECTQCTADHGTACKKRISFHLTQTSEDLHHTCAKRPVYFNQPSLDDAIFLLDMFKLDKNIKPA